MFFSSSSRGYLSPEFSGIGKGVRITPLDATPLPLLSSALSSRFLVIGEGVRVTPPGVTSIPPIPPPPSLRIERRRYPQTQKKKLTSPSPHRQLKRQAASP